MNAILSFYWHDDCYIICDHFLFKKNKNKMRDKQQI